MIRTVEMALLRKFHHEAARGLDLFAKMPRVMAQLSFGDGVYIFESLRLVVVFLVLHKINPSFSLEDTISLHLARS